MQIGITEVTLVIGLPNSTKTTIFNNGAVETAPTTSPSRPELALRDEGSAAIQFCSKGQSAKANLVLLLPRCFGFPEHSRRVSTCFNRPIQTCQYVV